jgi:hypothetical protein
MGVKARIMPKKPKKPNDNSQESTLGPFAKAVSEIANNKTPEDKPADAEPEEPGGGGDSGMAREAEKGEAPPEGETPEGL